MTIDNDIVVLKSEKVSSIVIMEVKDYVSKFDEVINTVLKQEFMYETTSQSTLANLRKILSFHSRNHE